MYNDDWKLTCKDCACYTCTQRENCNMSGCDGGGCTQDDLGYFVDDCDDYEAEW